METNYLQRTSIAIDDNADFTVRRPTSQDIPTTSFGCEKNSSAINRQDDKSCVHSCSDNGVNIKINYSAVSNTQHFRKK